MHGQGRESFSDAVSGYLRKRDNPALNFRLHFLPTVGSTNVKAAELARSGGPEGTIVIADAQTGGKGRLGRVWVSPPGVNLYLSLVLRPSLQISSYPQLSLVAAIAVAEAITHVTHLEPSIKWPNDVLISGKKVCGILTEMQTKGPSRASVVVGIGVNINGDSDSFPLEIRKRATSLKLMKGVPVDRGLFTAGVLTQLEKLYLVWLKSGFAPLQRMWCRYAGKFLGRTVRVSGPEGIISGIAVGIDEEGALLLEGSGRQDLRRIVVGDVSVLKGR